MKTPPRLILVRRRKRRRDKNYFQFFFVQPKIRTLRVTWGGSGSGGESRREWEWRGVGEPVQREKDPIRTTFNIPGGSIAPGGKKQRAGETKFQIQIAFAVERGSPFYSYLGGTPTPTKAHPDLPYFSTALHPFASPCLWPVPLADAGVSLASWYLCFYFAN